MSSSYGRNTFIHELFHQIQYSINPSNFFSLINEYFLNEDVAKFGLNPSVKFIDHTGGMVLIPDYSTRVNNYTYKYDLEKISSLSDLPYLEAQAQLVGDFAEFYYDERYSSGVKYSWNKQNMKKMAEIMKNSGYNTEAVNWVLENY